MTTKITKTHLSGLLDGLIDAYRRSSAGQGRCGTPEHGATFAIGELVSFLPASDQVEAIEAICAFADQRANVALSKARQIIEDAEHDLIAQAKAAPDDEAAPLKLTEPVAPWFYFVECDDPDYSGLFNHKSEAQTQANDHGGKVIPLWNVPPTYTHPQPERGGVPDEIAEIGELIRTQDNRCTDQPLFAVMKKRGMVTMDTHDYDRIEWVESETGDYCFADETKSRRLEALYQGGRETPGWDRYAMKDVDVFVTACFTEQGCKDFIARDGHNHRQPFIYAFGSYRNNEFRAVRAMLAAAQEVK